MSTVTNSDITVLRHFAGVDHVLLFIKHFCVEIIGFFPLERIYVLVPGFRLAVLPSAFCLADARPGHKGEFMAGLGKNTREEKKRDLAVEREAC